jgi:hypothetical protein
MIITDYFVQLCEKAGIDTKDTDLIDLLSKSDLSKIQISDSLIEKINKNVITKEEAKNSPELKKHFYGNALDPINKKIAAFFDEYGFDDGMKAEVLADTSTYSQFEKTVKKIAELKEKQSTSGNKGEKADLEKKINELASELSKVAKQKEDEKIAAVNEVTQKYENQFLEMNIDSIIGSQKLPGLQSKDIEMITAKAIVNKKLAEKGAIVKNIDGKLVLVAKDNQDLRIFDAGKEISFDSLTEMALAENKFLKVSGGNPAPTNNGFNRNNGGQNPPKQNAATNLALSEIDIALEGFKE